MATAPLPALAPPIIEFPIDDSTGKQSQPWAQHHQDVADRLNTVAARLVDGLTGIVDGSEPPAGKVGELLISEVTGISLPQTSVTSVTVLSLSPGDWDVFGALEFLPSSSAHAQQLQAGIGAGPSDLGPVATSIATDFQTGIATRLIAGPRRSNSATPTTVYLTASAIWTGGGSIQAHGVIRARRMR